jgi:FtsP/CotA-like multicopper oxidase with cupredoxin domain
MVGNPPKEVTIKQSMAPIFMIDNEQFSEHKYYQTMVLGEEEEWTIINTTIVPHPFHIHVNPFQVVEIFDPNEGGIKRKWDKFGVWQDVIAIPSALKDTTTGKLLIDPDTGVAKTPGYLRIRTKFVDFTGSFVLHCHILAHEDRGMMQLVRVISGKTTLRHH